MAYGWHNELLAKCERNSVLFNALSAVRMAALSVILRHILIPVCFYSLEPTNSSKRQFFRLFFPFVKNRCRHSTKRKSHPDDQHYWVKCTRVMFVFGKRQRPALLGHFLSDVAFLKSCFLAGPCAEQGTCILSLFKIMTEEKGPSLLSVNR